MKFRDEDYVYKKGDNVEDEEEKDIMNEIVENIFDEESSDEENENEEF